MPPPLDNFVKNLTIFEVSSTKQIMERVMSRAYCGTGEARGHPSQSRGPRLREEPATVEVIDESNDDLVEIRPAATVRSRPQTVSRISAPDQRQERASMWGQLSGQPLDADLPRDDVYFYGPGTELDLGRGVLKWPLVYATGAAIRGTFDASLIDGTLPVAPPGAPVAEGLPYWPNYYDCSPAQRSHYLGWLLSGKSAPDAELGYVFIYFYGLERRVLVDQADHLPVAQELIRLLPIYGHSNSFRRYAGTLLWLTLYLASESSPVPQALLNEAIKVTGRWNDELLAMCLAVLQAGKRPLPAHVAFLVAQNDPRSSSSVIVRRHREEFEKLFAAKYRKRFADGIVLRASKRPKRIDYRPASGTLLRRLGTADGISVSTMPDTLSISSQFKPIVHSWEESIEELRAFSRAHSSAGGELTAEAYEALPPELRC